MQTLKELALQKVVETKADCFGKVYFAKMRYFYLIHCDELEEKVLPFIQRETGLRFLPAEILEAIIWLVIDTAREVADTGNPADRDISFMLATNYEYFFDETIPNDVDAWLTFRDRSRRCPQQHSAPLGRKTRTEVAELITGHMLDGLKGGRLPCKIFLEMEGNRNPHEWVDFGYRCVFLTD